MIRSFEIISSRALRYARTPWSERLHTWLARLGSRSLSTVNPEEWSRHLRRDVGLPDLGPTERPLLPSQAPCYWPPSWRD
jgi:hypothetical protein